MCRAYALIAEATNRCLALLSHMFTMAETWGLRPDNSNPCRHVERFKENKRERYLSEAEMARLGTTLGEVEADGSESVIAVAAIRLLVFTGCRVSEITKLRWEHVNLGTRARRRPSATRTSATIPCARRRRPPAHASWRP